MKKIVRVLIAVALAAAAAPVSGSTNATASPIPEPEELWLMNADGSNQHALYQPESFPSVSRAGPSWSPDGTEIAFATWDALQVIPAVGGTPRTLASDSIDSVAWAPDGAWIAFSRFSGSPRGLFLVRPDGAGEHQLGPDAQVVGRPAWSPDSGRVAFVTATHPEEPFRLYVVSARDGTTRIVDPNALPHSPSWAPDGNRLAYINAGGHLAVTDLDEPGVVIVENAGTPDWSPDGSKIAFAADGGGIAAVNPDGSGLIALAPSGRGPEWDPAGARVAYSDGEDVYSVKRDGGGLTNLTNTDAYWEFSPRWSPGGSSIAYVAERAPFIPPDETIESAIRLRTRWHLTFKGRVVRAGTSQGACEFERRKVLIQKRKPWGWKTIARTETEWGTGRYRVKVTDRQGRFRAVVKETITAGDGGNQITCTAARSRVVRHRH